MKPISIATAGGDFAENKDIARTMRLERIEPALERGLDVHLDFSGVSLTTQSFVHALISATIREKGADVLDHIFFRGCNEEVKSIISTVVHYSQEGAPDA